MSELDAREETVFYTRAIKTTYGALRPDGVLFMKPFGDDGEIFFPPHENMADSPTPRIRDCRFAALQLGNKGYVVYDRLLSRVVDGVYWGADALENALGVAQLYNDGGGNPDMAPNGDALGLHYPKGRAS